MGGKKPTAIADGCSAPTMSPYWQVVFEILLLQRPLRYVDWTNPTASYPRCRRSSDAACAALKSSAGCGDCGHLLRICSVSRGRRFVQEYRGLPEMVGHSGCCFGLCARGHGFHGNGGGSRQSKQTSRRRTYRAYRILIHGIFVMLVVFFLAGKRITWINCLTGFGWRAWLLLYALPSWFTVVKTPAAK
jgi:hypothetical protein